MLIDGRWTRDATLRQFTGRDEEWLAGWDRSAPSAFVQSALLERCVTRIGRSEANGDLIRDMLVGDRDYLLLCLRRLCLGSKFDAVTECPRCLSRIELNFDADDIPVEERPQRAARFDAELIRGDGTSVHVVYHLPRGRDQERAALARDRTTTATLLESCLEEVDGDKDQEAPAGLLDPTAQQQLAQLMEQQAPQVTPDMDLVCPVCGLGISRDFELAPFLLDELGAGAQRILHEVHTLAYNYHWHEDEILDLPRPRRHVYLGLLLQESQGVEA
jgi:hypothetical protein